MIVTTSPSTHEARAIEWLSAAIMLVWGITLALPGDSVAQPHFSAFRHAHLTEGMMAAVFGIVGAARVVALYINGRWPKSPIIRIIGATAGAVLWSQVAWYLCSGTWLLSGIPNAGVGTYAALAIADLFSISRAAFDARYHRS
jgi:hypothetical protein